MEQNMTVYGQHIQFWITSVDIFACWCIHMTSAQVQDTSDILHYSRIYESVGRNSKTMFEGVHVLIHKGKDSCSKTDQNYRSNFEHFELPSRDLVPEHTEMDQNIDLSFGLSRFDTNHTLFDSFCRLDKTSIHLGRCPSAISTKSWIFIVLFEVNFEVLIRYVFGGFVP